VRRNGACAPRWRRLRSRGVPVLGGALLLLPLIAAACRRPPDPARLKDFNLIVINVDTLRADHLGCYGYGRPTSPFVDRLASEGVVFERALSNSSYTRESVAVLESGRLPSCSGSVGWNAHPRAARPSLGRFFQNAAYRTGFFSVTPMLTHPEFAAGFGYVRQGWEAPDGFGRSGLGPRLSALALAFVKPHAKEKLMMYLHYLDPHGPYEPSDESYHRLAPEPFPSPVALYKDLRPHFDSFLATGFGPGDRRFEDMVLRYDAEIADTDHAIELLFQGLEELHVLDHTLVLLTADHGEEFLEHGFIEHAWTLYGEVLHVPLILWAPRALRPQRSAVPAATVDVLPTILQLMQIPYEPGDFDGRALLTRDGAVTPPARPYLGELLLEERNVARAVVADGWKYIAAQRWLTPAERPRTAQVEDWQRAHGAVAPVDLAGPVVHEELYHLADDPPERHDLTASAPEQLATLRERLREELAGCAQQRSVHGHGALRAEPLSPADAERLRSLGYLHE